MAKFSVTVGDANYEVDAPDEGTAWKYANFYATKGEGNIVKPPEKYTPSGEVNYRGDIPATGFDNVPYNGGAKVNDAAAKFLPAPVAAGLGLAANTALSAGPMIAGGAVGLAAKPISMAAGEWAMGKAIRPILADRLSGKFAKARTTMLEEGYNPTIGGTEAMGARAAKNDARVAEILNPSTATVDKYAVADRLRPVLDSAEISPLPTSGTNTISNAWTEFLSHPKLSGGPDIPVQLAQAMKQRGYKEMGDAAYGIGLKPAAERDAIKGITRGLKEEIELAVPEVAPINAETSALLNAKKVAQRRAFTEANNNTVSLGTTIATAANNPLLAAGMWANSSSYAKAMLARMLYMGGKGLPTTGAASGAALGEYMRQNQGEGQ